MMNIFYFCFFGFSIFISASFTHALSSNDTTYRLPSTVKPLHYLIKLYLDPIKNNAEFYGETNITIDIVMPSNNLILHSGRLIIEEITLISDDGLRMKPLNYLIDNKTDFLTVNFAEIILEGKYILNFNYSGMIKSELSGTTQGLCTDDNEITPFIFTRLLTTGARQVFPCWDEPNLKANFTVIINHDKHYKAISNMHAIRVEPDELDSSMQTTIFADTPKMSTHSLAIVVADLVYQESNDGIIRLWSSRDSIDKTENTMKIVRKILDFMKNFTDISYIDMGFQKLDIVSLSTSIEPIGSWGLITISPDFIDHIENDITDMASKDHSVSHLSYMCIQQWFGNLVTPAWWSDKWLYEGVATYLEFIITEQILDSWRAIDRIAIKSRIDSMSYVDNRPYAKSLKADIKLSHYSNETYKTILREKSVNIISMTSYIVGNTILRMTLQNFLRNYSFQAASSNDFIDLLTVMIKNDSTIFHEILNNWITTPGFPIVTVQRNYTAGTAIISQSRYFKYYDNNSVNDTKYWVPINFASQDNIDFNNSTVTNWLNPNEESIEINKLEDNNWIILNKQSFGYYCVNYDIKNWQLIIKTLKSNNYTDIPVLNRAQLLYDAIQLTLIDQLDYGTLISLLGYLEHETDFLPWIVSWATIIAEIKQKLLTTEYYFPFQEYIKNLPNKLINKIGYKELENDDGVTRMYRDLAFNSACAWGATSCLDISRDLVAKWLNNPEKNIIPEELEQTIFCSGIRGGNQSIWDAMMQKSIIDEKYSILYGLGCTLNKTNLNILLSKTIEENSNVMIITTIFKSITSDRDAGQGIALDFVIKNWKLIRTVYRPLVFQLVTFFIIKKDQFDKINNFVQSNYNELTAREKSVLNNNIQVFLKRSRKSNLSIPELDNIFFKNNPTQEELIPIPSVLLIGARN